MNIDYEDVAGLADGTTSREHRLLDQLDRMESSVMLLLDFLEDYNITVPEHTKANVDDDMQMADKTLTESGFNRKHYGL